MEHAEGKLVVEENGYGQKVLIRVKGDDVNIATTLATVLELANNIEQDEANAEHLVKCWNCHEPLLKACRALVKDKELIEQDEGIFACQCLARAPDDITEPPKCSYCQAEAAIAAADQEQSKEKKQ